jgi:protein-disulfide isomerase
LAAREQGKYEEFHWSLMGLRRATKETVLQAATDLGMDIEKLQQDMMAEDVSEHIAISMQLANAIGFTGTPSFVIGNRTAPGAVSYEEMRRMVEAARSDNENGR